MNNNSSSSCRRETATALFRFVIPRLSNLTTKMKYRRKLKKYFRFLEQYLDIITCIYYITEQSIKNPILRIGLTILFSFFINRQCYVSYFPISMLLLITIASTYSKFDVFQQTIIFLLSNRFYLFSVLPWNIRITSLITAFFFSFSALINIKHDNFVFSCIVLLSSYSISILFSLLYPSKKMKLIRVNWYTPLSIAVILVLLRRRVEVLQIIFFSSFILRIFLLFILYEPRQRRVQGAVRLRLQNGMFCLS